MLALLLALVLAVPGLSQAAQYDIRVYPLERAGVPLHLECISLAGSRPEKNILLAHGVTYSSHEFDLDYQDYSLARFLARQGWAVWLMDVAGFGSSGRVENGFLPDSHYAAQDLGAAADLILRQTGQEKIDLLGWSWGTVTASRFAAKHPAKVNKLVLYAPILSGLGEVHVEEDFHHNTWEHAASDFQMDEQGNFDLTITDPVVISLFCSGCWRYDGEESPNGGRRDLCVSPEQELIHLAAIEAPTLVICGDKDPYLNYELVYRALDHLPEGSALQVIHGAAHPLHLEKPYYQDFQARVSDFLAG